MGRLKDFMDKVERGEEDDSEVDRAAEQEALLNRQKETDLARAQARSVFRPIKKELRHSQIEGRYIRPEEIKKEVEKFEAAKREAARKKGLLGRFFGKKSKESLPDEKQKKQEPEKENDSKTERLQVSKTVEKQKAEQIRRLRGIASAQRNQPVKEIEDRFRAVNGLQMPQKQDDDIIPRDEKFDSIRHETGMSPEEEYRPSFSETVRKLRDDRNQEDFPPVSFPPESEYMPESFDEERMAAFLFSPLPPDRPDGIIATALSAAVGFVYWDEDEQKVDRIITIRKLFYKQGDILIDAFCHDIAAPRLIPFSRGIRMYNLQTMKPYDNPRDFLLHHITGLAENESLGTSGFAMALSVVRYELAALVFVAKSDFDRSEGENKLMLSYISRRCPTIDFDEREMLDYIAILVPDEQSFSEALEVIVKQPQDIVFLFGRTFLQMMLSDGILHENERELLAELLFRLKMEGMELNRIGFE